jgi:hypothetical protein
MTRAQGGSVRQWDQPATGARLRRHKHQSNPRLPLQRPQDMKDACRQVDIVPTQPQHLTLSQTQCKGHHTRRRQPRRSRRAMLPLAEIPQSC